MSEKPKYILLPLTGIHLGNSLWLEGQVLHLRRHHKEIIAGESRWKNVIRVISAYLPGNMKTGTLEIHIGGSLRKITPAYNGFFNIRMNNIPANDLDSGLQYYFLRNDKRYSVKVPEFYRRNIYKMNGFDTGIISDIDDTIMISHAKNHIKKARHLLIKNAFRRKAVAQMSAIYRVFRDNNLNLFYVSNSEANLYPMIHTFLKHHGFPEGPLFLKPYRRWSDLLKRAKKTTYSKHKKEKIRDILRTFNNRKFILIGDDSQRDPEVYRDIARDYPERIKGIFIRKTGRKTGHRIRRMSEDVTGKNDPVVHSFAFPEELVPLINPGESER